MQFRKMSEINDVRTMRQWTFIYTVQKLTANER